MMRACMVPEVRQRSDPGAWDDVLCLLWSEPWNGTGWGTVLRADLGQSARRRGARFGR